ncbi:MAG: SAM-dependent methyltransferase [Verrucomicrobiota bacterium]|jgi:SAM-dependent MidA family methyltransferase
MNAPAEIIRREIAEHGVLPFARFMELALYCPDSGYYEMKKDSPGRRGDFYTSVSAGDLFGQLLAFQFAGWLDEIRSLGPQPSTLNIVEAGAHDGTLARDILTWLQSARSELFGRIEYNIVEPSLRRQAWQKDTLKHFAPRVRWLSRFNNSTSQRFNGVIFSNELLDAMPVHRFGWDAKNKTWFEWGVALAGEKFVWAKIRTPDARPRMPAPTLCEVLPDGYTIETCPDAENWWRVAANILEHGRLLTIDYGLTDDELFSPGRTHGTLRAYFRHHATDDLLANVGKQDLTAHVNFSTIQSIGEACGLETESFSTQAQFLTRIVEKASKDKKFGRLAASNRLVSPKSGGGGSEDGWGAKQARQFQTLTHPEHLGRAFRVLIQSG